MRKTGAPPPATVESAEAAAAEPSSKKSFVLLVASCLVVAGILAGAGYYYYFGTGSGETPLSKATGKTTAAEAKGGPKPGAEASAKAPEAPGAETGEPATDAGEVAKPTDPLSIFPPDVNLLAHVTFGELANIGPIRDAMEALLKEEEPSKLLADAGFDPLAHLRGIWAGSSLEEKKEPSPLLILEGTFDQEKILSGLKKASLLIDSPKKVGRLEVYEGQSGGKFDGYLTFLSEEQVLLGGKDLFNKALKLVDGGDSVRSNEKLKSLSKDFSGGGLAWIAASLPPEMLKGLAPPGAAPPENKGSDEKQAAEKAEGDKEAKEKPKKEEKAPVSMVPKITGILLSLDRSSEGEGLSLGLAVPCSSPEEAKKAQGILGGWKFFAALQAPPDLKPLLANLKAEVEADTLRVTLDVPANMLKKLLGNVVKVEEPPLPEEGTKDSAGDGAGEGAAAGEKTEAKEGAEPETKDEAKEEPKEATEEKKDDAKESDKPEKKE
jgi:hypothetical protein